jgi:integrase/recombinase XerD
MSDGAAIDRFLEMMAAERGASRNTLAAYRRDLAQAAEFVAGRLADADVAVLRKLMADYQSLAASSAARKLSTLRQFFAFLLDAPTIRRSPSRGRRRAARCRVS